MSFGTGIIVAAGTPVKMPEREMYQTEVKPCRTICYAAASSPIPLYENYSQLIGLSNADMSFSSALYFIGTVIPLLLLSRLSDYWGAAADDYWYVIAVIGRLFLISFYGKF